MKKTFLFILSMTFAFGITFYIKKKESTVLSHHKQQWKTFVKKSDKEVASHPTTNKEFEDAKIKKPESILTSARSPATVKSNPYQGFMVRNNRILMGELDQKYEDDETDLKMINTPNPDWKEIMGYELMRFQDEDTKLMVKEEVPVIKIAEGKGRFLEQVVVTYLKKDGEKNSFKALVDSETGAVIETWDRTIHENLYKKREGLILPSVNDSGIITR